MSNINGGYECRRRSNVTYLKLIHRLINVPGLTEHDKGMRRFNFGNRHFVK